MSDIQIGKIVGTHALKGELKIRSKGNLAQECLVKGNIVLIQGTEFEIQTCRVHKTNFLVSFKGYLDINLVEKYIGSPVYVPEENIEIEEEMYLVRDLLECCVYLDDKLIGSIIDVIDNGRHDVLVVEINKKKTMIPYVDAFIKSEDIENNRIDINVIEGLINEN